MDGRHFDNLPFAVYYSTPFIPHSSLHSFTPHFYTYVATFRYTNGFTKWKVNREPREHAFGEMMRCNWNIATGFSLGKENGCKCTKEAMYSYRTRRRFRSLGNNFRYGRIDRTISTPDTIMVMTIQYENTSISTKSKREKVRSYQHRICYRSPFTQERWWMLYLPIWSSECWIRWKFQTCCSLLVRCCTRMIKLPTRLFNMRLASRMCSYNIRSLHGSLHT